MIDMNGNFTKFSSQTEDDKLVVKATYVVQGISFDCTLNEQKDENTLRGRVSIADPFSGNVMQVVGRKKDERLAKNPEADLTIYKVASCKKWHKKKSSAIKQMITKAQMKEKLEDTAKKILIEHEECIVENLKSLSEGDLHPLTSILVCKRSFFETFHSNQTLPEREKKERKLLEICNMLPDKKLNTIEKKDVSMLYEAFNSGRTAKDMVKLLEQYLSHCVEWGEKENPCSVFLDDLGDYVKNIGEQLMKQAFKSKSLQLDEEILLNQLIAEAEPGNGLVTGLLLAKELGLTNTKILKLSWTDILWESAGLPFVRVKQTNDQNAGATHNYTKPCPPFAGRELHRRYDWAMETYAEDAGNQPVVAKLNGKKVELKVLTAFIKETISQVKTKLGRETGTEGTTFLQTNYEHQLVYTYGLPADSGVINYLKGQPLAGNVTADNYRCFSYHGGFRYIYGHLCRGDAGTPSEESVAYETSLDQQAITVHPVEAGRFTQVQGKIFVSANCELHIITQFGVSGVLNIAPMAQVTTTSDSGDAIQSIPSKHVKQSDETATSSASGSDDQLTMF